MLSFTQLNYLSDLKSHIQCKKTQPNTGKILPNLFSPWGANKSKSTTDFCRHAFKKEKNTRWCEMLVFDTFIETLETKLPRCVCHKYCRLQKRLPPKPRKTVPNRRAEQAPLALAALSSHELSEANGPGSAVSRSKAEAAAGCRARGHGGPASSPGSTQPSGNPCSGSTWGKLGSPPAKQDQAESRCSLFRLEHCKSHKVLENEKKLNLLFFKIGSC